MPSSETLTATAYAKINLTLDVFSKRADGYHSIASILQVISLHDTLVFSRHAEPGIRFTCDAPEGSAIPTDATNLVVRAAQSIFDQAHEQGHTLSSGVAIHLTKQIPAQAGLGGGSSNAAATLLAMNRLFELKFDSKTLHSLASSLGSDVPFFLVGGTAVARGRGETLTPLPDVPPFWLVVVKPEENVSTAWAYGELDNAPNRQSHRGTMRLETALREDDRGRLLAFQSNDFELPVFEHLPRLAWLRDEIEMAGALAVHLCGSGSALYGVAESEAAAARIADLLRRRYTHVFVARTLARAQSDPLHASADTKTQEEPPR